jgi:hypothetical protein
MDIHGEIDFDDLYEVDVIFRTVESVQDGDSIRNITAQFRSELAITWDMIDAVQQYPHDDNWTDDFHGDKYYLHLNRGMGSHVIKGNYFHMKELFRQYLAEMRKRHDRDTGY